MAVSTIPLTSAVSGTLPLANGGTATTGAPAFSVYNGSNFTVATGNWVKVPFNTEVFDTNNNFNTSTNRFTPTVAGYYQVNTRVVSSGYTTDQTILAFWKNGSEFQRLMQIPNSTQSSICPMGSALISMNGSTDYLEVYVLQFSGSSQTFLGNYPAESWFNGSMVRSA